MPIPSVIGAFLHRDGTFSHGAQADTTEFILKFGVPMLKQNP